MLLRFANISLYVRSSNSFFLFLLFSATPASPNIQDPQDWNQPVESGDVMEPGIMTSADDDESEEDDDSDTPLIIDGRNDKNFMTVHLGRLDQGVGRDLQVQWNSYYPM